MRGPSTLVDRYASGRSEKSVNGSGKKFELVLELAQSSVKTAEAKAVIQRCVRAKGFHASTQLYSEFWVRDLVYSEDVLLKLGYGETIKKHLLAFLDLQRKNGNLPTVITSFWRRSLNQTFHFWSCDTEILFVIGSLDYASYTGDSEFLRSKGEQIDRCVSFINGRVNKLGLIPGIDWRDAIIGLDRRFLLSNQVQLASLYEKLGQNEKSKALMETIHDVFYLPDQGYFADSVWWSNGILQRDLRFDSMGSALGIINGTILPRMYSGLEKQFLLAESEYGCRNVTPAYQASRASAFRSVRGLNAFVRNGAVIRNRKGSYQNSGIWPFVEARVIAALRKMGISAEAQKASDRMLARNGMNEWYSPVDGAPHGSGGQLWTAAAIIAQSQTA